MGDYIMLKPNLILPFLLILAAGMGIGSLHNAQARGGLPGFFTPFGFTLIALTFVIFVMGFIVYRYYDHPGSLSWGKALVASLIAMVLELVNLLTTLMSEGSLAGWLFHEYLGVAAGVLVFAKLLTERRRA